MQPAVNIQISALLKKFNDELADFRASVYPTNKPRSEIQIDVTLVREKESARKQFIEFSTDMKVRNCFNYFFNLI